MTVHSIHIFDRKGKTLFTKKYSSSSTNDTELRQLVFGMLFSLRELVASLTPEQASMQQQGGGGGTCGYLIMYLHISGIYVHQKSSQSHFI